MATSQHRNYPLPDEERKVNEEFWTLALETLPRIDLDIHTLFEALALVAARDHGHDIDGIEGLRIALEGKMPANREFSLADLVDVEGSNEAPDGYVLVKVSGKYVAQAASAAIGEHEHPIAKILGLEDALGGKLNKDAGNVGDAAAQAAFRAAIGVTVGPWASQPIGVPIPVWDNLTGVSAPPTDDVAFRYIKLTASDPYNAGVLGSESVSGTAPNITATAVVTLAGSPLNGQTVPLVNTDYRFIRAGSPGTKQQSQNLSHGHTGTAAAAGAHSHTFTTGSGSNQSGSNPGRQNNNGSPIDAPTSSAPAHTHTLTINANGGDEARPSNIGATYYMRIK